MKKLLLMIFLSIEIPVAGIGVSLENYLQAQAEALEESDDNSTIDNIINDCCLFYDNVDPDLVRAMISVESDGDIEAFNINDNGTEDYGLMQINTCNHAWLEEELGITDWYDPEQNIRAGVYILHGLFNEYSNTHQVLMSYNMGERRVKELWREGIRSSKYSRSIMKKFNKLKEDKK